jgi:hypothetical protein
MFKRRPYTQHNDTQNNGIQHKDTQNNGIQNGGFQRDNTQHKDIQHYIQHNGITY